MVWILLKVMFVIFGPQDIHSWSFGGDVQHDQRCTITFYIKRGGVFLNHKEWPEAGHGTKTHSTFFVLHFLFAAVQNHNDGRFLSSFLCTVGVFNIASTFYSVVLNHEKRVVILGLMYVFLLWTGSNDKTHGIWVR